MAYRIIDPKVIRASALRRDRVYPHAEWKPIPENDTQRVTGPPRLFIVHTMGSSASVDADGLWRWMNGSSSDVESEFILSYNGRLIQCMDVDREAHTAYKANPYAMCVETQDDGYLADPGINNSRWTGAQIEQMAGIAAWLHQRDGVPLDIPGRWDGAGVGYHRMFAEWSGRGTAHTCPGATRIGQFQQIITLARQIVADGIDTGDLELTMGQYEDIMAKLDEIDREATARHGWLVDHINTRASKTQVSTMAADLADRIRKLPGQVWSSAVPNQIAGRDTWAEVPLVYGHQAATQARDLAARLVAHFLPDDDDPPTPS